MLSSSISNFQKKIWDKWNIRVVILFSLLLQFFLTVVAPSRKRTRSFFLLFVWLAYLLADWAPVYCIGLISNNQHKKSSLSQNDNLMAFWGPFLLLHLGGPDTISAFALEDNELWPRQLGGLIFQSLAAAYVFLLTHPQNTLWLPTIFMFVAGLIKYAEKTYAFYVAAFNNFRIERPYQKSHNTEQKVRAQNEDHIKSVQKAFFFFNKFQGLIVDMVYSFIDCLESREYLKSKTAEDALMLIEIELNFMYQVFYTKASIISRSWFWFVAKFVSFILIMATLVLFIKAKYGDNGFDESDVVVTYALLSGALVLDVMALVMRFFTDYTATLSDESLIDYETASFYQIFQFRRFKYLNKKYLERFLWLKKPTWSKIEEGPYKGCEKLSTKFLFRRWCGSISGHNLLKYCLDESVPRVPNYNPHRSFYIDRVIQRVCFRIVVCVQDLFYQRGKCSRFKDLLDQLRYESKNPFLKELWKCVFDKLIEKSNEAGQEDIGAIRSICSARGERVIQKENLESLKPFVDPSKVDFDESLLLWHIATTLCYAKKARVKGHKREISMLLSDYMLYLLTMQPNMMSAIRGIGQKRFQDTCEAAKSFFRTKFSAKGDRKDRKAMWERACRDLKEVPTDMEHGVVKSVLSDACRLATKLEELADEDRKWEIITSVWVELLSYAASHCRPKGHVRLLGKGGELISIVWFLMVQLGLSTQFQIKLRDLYKR